MGSSDGGGEAAVAGQASVRAMNEKVCENLSHFKAILSEQRRVDDNIILRLNTAQTAAGTDCQALFGVLRAAYGQREHDIQFCLGVLDRKIEQRRDQNRQSFTLETQRDWVGNERGVERIVKRRSMAAFRSRCPFVELPAEFASLLETQEH